MATRSLLRWQFLFLQVMKRNISISVSTQPSFHLSVSLWIASRKIWQNTQVQRRLLCVCEWYKCSSHDEELGAYAKHITTQAKISHRWELRHDHIGFNYRMPNINAAMGCAQLENIDKYVASKRKVDAEYEEYFKNVSDIEFFVDFPNTISNYWLNAVILKDKEEQIDFLTQTNDNGVMTRPIWELMNRLPMFENCENDGLENTIWFADRVVNIPSSVRCKDL